MAKNCWGVCGFAMVALTLITGASPARAQAPPAAATVPDPPTSDSTRLFFGPTGRALKSREGYFLLHGPIVPTFQVGITDRFSIGGGSLFFAYGNFWVTPKVQVYRGPRTSVSAGVLHLVIPNEGSLGVAYVVSTHDTARGAWTFGAGTAYSSAKDEFGGREWHGAGPLILVGGERQFSQRVAFVTENYFVPVSGGMSFTGVRATWGRFSLDALAMVLVADDVQLASPTLNLAWRF